MQKRTAAVAAAFVMAVIGARSAQAQGMPVIDLMRLVSAIENGFTMYNNLQAAYAQLESSYKQIEAQAKAFEAFNPQEMLSGNMVHNFKNTLSYASRQMDRAVAIQNVLNRRDIRIGNSNFSIADFYQQRPDKTFAEVLVEGYAFVVADPLERDLTEHDRAVFWQKYGMSYGNYIRYNDLGNAIKTSAAMVKAEIEGFQDDAERDMEIINQLMEETTGHDSQLVGMAVGNYMAYQNLNEAKRSNEILLNLQQGFSNINMLFLEQRARNEDTRYNRGSVEITEAMQMAAQDAAERARLVDAEERRRRIEERLGPPPGGYLQDPRTGAWYGEPIADRINELP